MSHSNFAKIHPPNSSNHKSPIHLDAKVAQPCWVPLSDFYGTAPSLTWRGRSWPAARKLIKCLLLLQGSQPSGVTCKFPPSLPCNDTKGKDRLLLTHVGEYSVSVDTLCDSAGSGEYWARISVLILSCMWWGCDGNDSGYHRVTHGSFCTETSFYTEDIYIYLYIFIYIYITHTRKLTHTHAHTHTHTHKRSLIGFLCSSKNSWQPGSKAEKGLGAADNVHYASSLTGRHSCLSDKWNRFLPGTGIISHWRRHRSRRPSALFLWACRIHEAV